MARQLCYRGICKKLLRSDGQQRNYGKEKFTSNLNCGQKTVSEMGPCLINKRKCGLRSGYLMTSSNYPPVRLNSCGDVILVTVGKLDAFDALSSDIGNGIKLRIGAITSTNAISVIHLTYHIIITLTCGLQLVVWYVHCFHPIERRTLCFHLLLVSL